LRARQFPRAAEESVQKFGAATSPSRADYEHLVGYFASGFLAYATPQRASAKYPGFPSANGPARDRLEGFSRTAPLLAAWLSTSETTSLDVPGRGPTDLADVLRSGFRAGSDPSSPDYWGAIQSHDQRIAEAADIALALWLSRASVWEHLSADERRRIADWL